MDNKIPILQNHLILVFCTVSKQWPKYNEFYFRPSSITTDNEMTNTYNKHCKKSKSGSPNLFKVTTRITNIILAICSNTSPSHSLTHKSKIINLTTAFTDAF